jgi:hypothetical protein
LLFAKLAESKFVSYYTVRHCERRRAAKDERGNPVLTLARSAFFIDFIKVNERADAQFYTLDCHAWLGCAAPLAMTTGGGTISYDQPS